MGIIKKQGIQTSFYAYVGVVIGFLINALMMPVILRTEEVGLFNFLNSITNVFSGVFSLGVSLITLVLFPPYKGENKTTVFLSFIILTSLIGTLLAFVSYIVFNDLIFSDENTAQSYLFFSLGFFIICFFRIVFRNVDSLIRMLKNTVIGPLSENLIVKVIVLLGLLYYLYISKNEFDILFFIFIIALSSPGIISIIYLFRKGQFKITLKGLKPLTTSFRSNLFSLGLFGILNVLGSRVVMEIDRIMISNTLNLESTAIYSTAFLFGLFINIPAIGIKRISSVIISGAWANNDLETIHNVYKKSCLNLTVIGTYLLLGVWLNLDYIFSYLPPVYAEGKYVMLYIGLSQLIDMGFGVNNEILASSKYYRYNAYFAGVLIVLVVALNALLIPIFGIDGAAMASLAAIASVNIAKYTFLYVKFKFQPFDYKLIKIIAPGVACLLLPFIIPSGSNNVLNIIITSTILTIVYWVPVYALKLSEDINQTINHYVRKIFKSDR